MSTEGNGSAPYSFRYSPMGTESRKQLPREVQAALLDVQEALVGDPDAFPAQTRPLSLDGRVRIYSHRSPSVQVTYEIDASNRIIHFLHFVAPQMQATKPLFISYSRKDLKWLQKLRQFLQPLEQQELIQVWDDTEIRPGSDWLGDIQKALDSARIAFFLVTQDFLNSPFITEKELPALLEAANNRGCLIFWIAVSSTTYEDSPLGKFQAVIPPNPPLDLMSEPEQNKAFIEVYRKLKAAVSVH